MPLESFIGSLNGIFVLTFRIKVLMNLITIIYKKETRIASAQVNKHDTEKIQCQILLARLNRLPTFVAKGALR